MLHPSSLVISSLGSLVDPQVRASNEHILIVRVPRAGGRPGCPSYSQRSERPFEEGFGEYHVLLDVGLQIARAGPPVVSRIADAASKADKLFRIGRRKHKIFGVSPDHAQSVDQHPDEDVGFPEACSIGACNQLRIHQRGECLQGIRRTQARVVVAMHHLQVLRGIFNVDESSRAILHVDLSRRDQLFELLSPELQCRGNVPGSVSVDEGVSVCFQSMAQCGVAGNMS